MSVSTRSTGYVESTLEVLYTGYVESTLEVLYTGYVESTFKRELYELLTGETATSYETSSLKIYRYDFFDCLHYEEQLLNRKVYFEKSGSKYGFLSG